MFLVIEIFFIALLSAILFMLYAGGRSSAKSGFRKARASGSWTGRERRRHARFKDTLEVEYIERKKPRLKNGTKTADISLGGLRLLLEEKLSKGGVLFLKIFLPGARNVVEGEAEIVWSEELDGADGDGKRIFHTGIKFITMKSPSDSRFMDYIQSLPQVQEAA